jgi:hypothetical protein
MTRSCAGRGDVVDQQDDLGAQEAVDHALLVGLVERRGEAQPQVGAGVELGGLRAARELSGRAHDGERDAAEVLERQDDAGLVGEGRVGG